MIRLLYLHCSLRSISSAVPRKRNAKAQFPSYARNATHATQGRCVEKYAREYATHAREYATTEILRNGIRNARKRIRKPN